MTAIPVRQQMSSAIKNLPSMSVITLVLLIIEELSLKLLLEDLPFLYGDAEEDGCIVMYVIATRVAGK